MREANVAPCDGRRSWGQRLCPLLVGAGGDDVAHGQSLAAEMAMG